MNKKPLSRKWLWLILLVIPMYFIFNGPQNNTMNVSKECDDYRDFADHLNKAINLAKDLFQASLVHARDVKKQDVLVVTDVVFENLSDFKKLGLPASPTTENPDIYDFRFHLFPNQLVRSDPMDVALYMTPMVAWPLLAERYPEKKHPVLLSHPRDAYQFDVKPLRIRWLDYGEIKSLLSADSNTFATENWPWLRREEIKPYLTELTCGSLDGQGG